MESSSAISYASSAGFNREVARRVWQLASLERVVLSSLAENQPITQALEELTLGLEHIASPGTLSSVRVVDEACGGRLRHGAAPSLPTSYVAEVDGQPVGPSAGSCGTAAWRRSAVIVTDISVDPLWEAYRESALAHGLRACWSVPIVATSGDLLGTFAFYYREARAPAAEDLVTIDGAARLARLVLERDRADSARRRALLREKALFAAARVLAEAEDPSQAMLDIAAALGEALGWNAAAVWLHDSASRSLTCRAHWSSDPMRFDDFVTETRQRSFAPGQGLPGRVYLSGEPEWLSTSQRDSGFLRARSAIDAGIHHGLAFPILAGGFTIGTIELFTTTATAADPDLLVALRSVGLQVGQFLRRARAQAERQRMVDELRETVRFSDLFAGVLAHDLRSPLNTLVMGTQILMKRADLPSHQVLMRMQNSGIRMARMIEQLLDLTRSRAGNGLALIRDPFALGDLANAILSELALAFPEAQLELHVSGDTRGEWDRDRLAQVLSNLIGNAIEHGSPGGVVNVRVDGHDPEAVRLETHNPGTIPAHALPSLFDPFKQARPGAKRSSGLGLGLYITRQIVTGHGGDVDVESDVSGTRFVLRLPRSAGADKAPESAGWLTPRPSQAG